MNKDYCKFCDSNTMTLRQNRNSGSWFYACTNYNDPSIKCTNTYQAGMAHEAQETQSQSPEPTQADLEAEQLRLDASRLRGELEGREWHRKHGIPYIGMEELAKMIPGFGKKYEDLTQAEKDTRAAILFPLIKGWVTKVTTMPYDKNQRDEQ